MGVAVDAGIVRGRAGQDINAVATRIDPGEAALGCVQWRRGSALDAKTEKDVTAAVWRERGVNKYG